ncbi:MAG: tungsten formylmethanofuran dehydrogenase [Bradyrhizobiaceae bacterium]|nr:tungsten formylmethanofuran dehydrogenase [Hyphomicrobiales bacterium]MBV9426571.1 tungsten formylmethanofuran dehydrogenase [Bradyrhizobiaceae bacterium]
MDHAWIDGQPVQLEAACAEAARLLERSRLPVIAGLGTDVAGARAAIALAQRTGAVVDHMHSEALLHVLDVVRDAGIMTTTPTEARLRADMLLLVGPLPADALPQLLSAKLRERIVIWLCPGGTVFGGKVQAIGRSPDLLPTLLAAARATIAGRPAGPAPVGVKTIRSLGDQLKAARFGVAVWSAAALDPLTIEMLCGLIKDLNVQTRFSGLPLPPGDNALGVLQVCGWMTALPPRTGFARGFAEHDPWRFDARRLVERGEADCVVWISTYDPAPPPWTRDVPTIALTSGGASLPRRPRVLIAVGCPGVDHDAIEYVAAAGTLAWEAAAARRTIIRVSDALDRIAAALPTSVASPC